MGISEREGERIRSLRNRDLNPRLVLYLYRRGASSPAATGEITPVDSKPPRDPTAEGFSHSVPLDLDRTVAGAWGTGQFR